MVETRTGRRNFGNPNMNNRAPIQAPNQALDPNLDFVVDPFETDLNPGKSEDKILHLTAKK